MSGPEPDHEWELFAAAVQSLSARLGAGPLIGFHGIPMGVPHTRPLGVISHGTRPELIDGRQQMPSSSRFPAAPRRCWNCAWASPAGTRSASP